MLLTVKPSNLIVLLCHKLHIFQLCSRRLTKTSLWDCSWTNRTHINDSLFFRWSVRSLSAFHCILLGKQYLLRDRWFLLKAIHLNRKEIPRFNSWSIRFPYWSLLLRFSIPKKKLCVFIQIDIFYFLWSFCNVIFCSTFLRILTNFRGKWSGWPWNLVKIEGIKGWGVYDEVFLIFPRLLFLKSPIWKSSFHKEL